MRKNILTAAAALIVGAGLGYTLGSGGDSAPEGSTPAKKEKEILYWQAPMNKEFRSDKPGKSPMGMDLIPVYAGEEGGSDDPNALKISAAVVNNIGVRTDTAIVSDLAREISTVGFVTIDEDLAAHVHVRTAGWVEKLHRKAEGEYVSKGELIFELYSPELVSAQIEFTQAIRLKQNSLMKASGERLKALGMTDGQIATLSKTGKVKQLVEVRAPQDGVITKLGAGEGMHIKPGQTVFSLADLSTVWVKVDVFEGQSDWVRKGQVASMTLPFLPGENWQGRVDYVYPVVESKSRTVQVRLAFPNPDGRLKPNMYGEVSLKAAPLKNVISIPREALIRTGKTDRVILALGEGKFRPAEVLAGRESGDRVEIMDGLAAGETIVTSGQFLIDSEASINSAFLRLLDASSEHEGHEGMDMEAADASEHEGHEGMDMDADDASEHDGHEGMDMEPTDAVVHSSMGVINFITDEGSVNLTHDPIQSLGWPGMTMSFGVASSFDFSSFKPGDRIHFELQQGEDGFFVITNAVSM